MKICWIGTSYFSMGELSDNKGVDIDWVYYIAKRHPTHEHLNLSIPGMGMNYVPYRLDYGLEEGATHFIIELPNGLRQNFISSMSKNEAHRKYLRIQEYKNGERVFVKEEKRQFYIDNFLANCDDEQLKMLMAESDFPFMHDKTFWDMIRKFSLMADDKFKRCEWIHNAYNIQKRLEAEGKKVMWIEWGMASTFKKAVTMESSDGKQVFSQCCTGADNSYKKLHLMSDPWPFEVKCLLQDGLITKQELDGTVGSFLKETDPREQHFAKQIDLWQNQNYYDGSHLNDEALRKYSSTFDQVIWDWENGK